MIDKKVIVLIGVLVVAALLIVVVSSVNFNFSSGSGSSFTALMDSMHETETGSLELVLPSTYLNNQEIKITDKIISIQSNGYSTTFYFVYTGTKWINESSGTSFDVLTHQGGHLLVRNAIFHVTLTGEFQDLYAVGGMITLKTSVRIDAGNPVLLGTWSIGSLT